MSIVGIFKNKLIWLAGLKLKFRITIIVICCLFLWFGIGLLIPNPPSASEDFSKKEESLPILKIMNVKRVRREVPYKTYGRIKLDTVKVKSISSSSIVRINKKSGDKVKKGAPLFSLLNDTVVRSPVSGVIDDVYVVKGETITTGHGIMSIVSSTGDIEVEINLPTKFKETSDAKQEKEPKGESKTSRTLYSIAIFPDGYACESSLFFLSNNINKTSGTILAKAKIKDCTSNKTRERVKNVRGIFSHNQVVNANVAVKENDAYLVPSYALQLNDSGNVFISILDSENKLKRHDVEVIEVLADGTWVVFDESDKYSSIRLVSFGAGYYSENDVVDKFTEIKAEEDSTGATVENAIQEDAKQ